LLAAADFGQQLRQETPAINLALDPDVLQLIADRVQSGQYPTPEAVIAAAVRVLDQQEQLGATVEERFRHLASVWHKAVAHHSSSTLRNNHPAYRKIIDLGFPVLPCLLRDLEANSTHWFRALREITGADPIPSAAAGNVSQMTEAWLRWAKEHGHQW